MRILVALDQYAPSTHALAQVARLSVNTWADITLLGIIPRKPDTEGMSKDFMDTMNQYQKTLLASFDPSICPYPQTVDPYELAEIRPGLYEKICHADSGLKDLTVRIRVGTPTKTILAEAQESSSDLIVLHNEMESQEKIATKAECSVLVVRKEKDKKKILCFLDDDLVSQRSLEMITQMTTLFDADLEVAAIAEKQGMKGNVEKKLGWLLNYFTQKDIPLWIELVGLSSLEKFIMQEDHWSLITMWMGETSLVERLFSVNKVAKLLKSGKASVLLLR